MSAYRSLLLTASRTALIGTCAAVLLYLFMVYYNRIKTLLKVCFSIIIIMTLSFSYWSPFLDNVQNKNKGTISAGGITSSRDEHWQKRIKEFTYSTFIGVGFATGADAGSVSTFN